MIKLKSINIKIYPYIISLKQRDLLGPPEYDHISGCIAELPQRPSEPLCFICALSFHFIIINVSKSHVGGVGELFRSYMLISNVCGPFCRPQLPADRHGCRLKLIQVDSKKQKDGVMVPKAPKLPQGSFG